MFTRNRSSCLCEILFFWEWLSSDSTEWMWRCVDTIACRTDTPGSWETAGTSRMTSVTRSVCLLFIYFLSIAVGLVPRNITSSAVAEGPRDALCQLKHCQPLHQCKKNRFWNDIQLSRDSIGHISHPNNSSKNVSILHLFRDITTFTMYVTLRSPSVSIRKLT